MRILKLTSAVATALLLSLAAGAGYAAPRRHPAGGHPGGGHPAPHAAAPHFAAPHAAPHFAPHVSVARHFAPRAHFAPHPRVGRPAIRHFTPRTRVGRVHPRGRIAHGRIAHGRIAHGRPSIGRTHHGRLAAHHVTPNVGHHVTHNVTHNLAHNALHPNAARLTRRTSPRNFARLRRLSGDPAFRPFLRARWHRHHHWGWVGPLFWPYAYGDFFYYALWPDQYGYYDPFWTYGYGDIYDGIFSPYDYSEYVQGPQAPERMAALTQAVAQSCTADAAEVTGWPIDQIQAAVQPNAQQSALLDDLGNAVVKASDAVRAHCPTALAFTPTDRLAQMQVRLQGVVQAVAIVEPPLRQFYDSLTDEQKARFNDIGAQQAKKAPTKTAQAAANPQAQCAQNVVSFPTDRIEEVVHPHDAQRAKLGALQAANAKAADLIKASCPSELPATPPDRLAAEGKHLQAMLAAVQTVRPALDDFYTSLSNEQKARFDNLGRQLFVQK